MMKGLAEVERNRRNHDEEESEEEERARDEMEERTGGFLEFPGCRGREERE
jgi:hypothetical protein